MDMYLVFLLSGLVASSILFGVSLTLFVIGVGISFVIGLRGE